MLNEIKEKLNEFNLPVYYGLVPQTLDDILDDWNYIVFRRLPTEKKGAYSYTDYYAVALVQEDYIQEGMVDEIINKLKELKVVRDDNTSIEYDYIFKPKTNMICEVAVIKFYKSRKILE